MLGTDVGMMAEFIPVEFLCEPNNIEALQQVIQNYLDVVALKQVLNRLMPWHKNN